ncbi:hypothetical protein LWI29_016602 [Acer saccharum]|uniref:Uncharacterized protein n=1 Tax=Acer saccharum TaxID=4024 RepID=A0AA39VG14_ACESA|nr:hypothetical protein LWI29_016602 [Acer saccharum]
MSLRFKAISDPDGSVSNLKEQKMDLGNGSVVVYVPRLLTSDESWKFFDYLNKEIPWIRPTIRVFGRSHVQVVVRFVFGGGSRFDLVVFWVRFGGGGMIRI